MKIELENITNEIVKTVTADVSVRVKEDNCNIAEFIKEAMVEPLVEAKMEVPQGTYRIRLLAVVTEDETNKTSGQ